MSRTSSMSTAVPIAPRCTARARHGAAAGLALLVLALSGVGALAQPSADPRQRGEPPPRVAPKKLTQVPPRPVVQAQPTQGGFDPRGGCGLKAGCGTGPVHINSAPSGTPQGLSPRPPTPTVRAQTTYTVTDCKAECRKAKPLIPAACKSICP